MDDVIDDTTIARMILIAGMMLTARLIPNDSPLLADEAPSERCVHARLDLRVSDYVPLALLACTNVRGTNQ